MTYKQKGCAPRPCSSKKRHASRARKAGLPVLFRQLRDLFAAKYPTCRLVLWPVSEADQPLVIAGEAFRCRIFGVAIFGAGPPGEAALRVYLTPQVPLPRMAAEIAARLEQLGDSWHILRGGTLLRVAPCVCG